MPESKSRRKGKKRRRHRRPAVQTPPKKRKTPRWVLPVFFGTMGAGILVIILNYLPIWEFQNYLLFVGLGLMGLSFVVATQIR